MSLRLRLARLETAALDGVIPESAYIAIWPIPADTGTEEARERVKAEVDAARAVGRRLIQINTVDAS